MLGVCGVVVAVFLFIEVVPLADCAVEYRRVSMTKFPQTSTFGVYSLDWSKKIDKIAFGQLPPRAPPENTRTDLYTINPDGTDETCITCDFPEMPLNNGDPTWSPDGEWIVFIAQNESVPPEYEKVGRPGAGINCDLWAVKPDGSRRTKLTFNGYPPVSGPFQGIMHPQFSHNEANPQLFWARRYEDGPSFGGGWKLQLADFVVELDTPRLENIVDIQPSPSPSLYESHAFSPDDSKILFCGNLDGLRPAGLDIYVYDLQTQQTTDLTNTPNAWDEHAHWSNDGEKIMWISSDGFDLEITPEMCDDHTWRNVIRTELWMMDADGSNKMRLTGFNIPGEADYDIYEGGQVVPSDSAFSPEGDRLLFLLSYNDTEIGTPLGGYYMMEFQVVVTSAVEPVGGWSLFLVFPLIALVF